MDVSPEALSQALNDAAAEPRVQPRARCASASTASASAPTKSSTRREEELAFLATHDALTGLPNRTLILDRLEQMLARAHAAARRRSRPCSSTSTTSRRVNDTLGHGAGDELLQAVAARLDGVVRDADALGRLGGDEFVRDRGGRLARRPAPS